MIVVPVKRQCNNSHCVKVIGNDVSLQALCVHCHQTTSLCVMTTNYSLKMSRKEWSLVTILLLLLLLLLLKCTDYRGAMTKTQQHTLHNQSEKCISDGKYWSICIGMSSAVDAK